MAEIHAAVLIESSTSPTDHSDRQRIPSLVTVEKPILDISGRADNTARAHQRRSSFLPPQSHPTSKVPDMADSHFARRPKWR